MILDKISPNAHNKIGPRSYMFDCQPREIIVKRLKKPKLLRLSKSIGGCLENPHFETRDSGYWVPRGRVCASSESALTSPRGTFTNNHFFFAILWITTCVFKFYILPPLCLDSCGLSFPTSRTELEAFFTRAMEQMDNFTFNLSYPCIVRACTRKDGSLHCSFYVLSFY